MLTTGNISLGPFVGLLDSMKNTNTSLRDIILKIFSQTRLQWVWTNQCYFWVEPPADCGFGEFSMHNTDRKNWSFSFLPGWEEPASDHLHVVQSGEKFAFKKEQGEKHWSYLGLSITKTVLTKPLIIQAWKDYQMTWNSSEFGGVESVVIHPKYLWTPDILLYNRWPSITYMK